MGEPGHPGAPLTVGVVGLGRLGAAVAAACARNGLPVRLTATRTGGWSAHAVPAVLVDASGHDGAGAAIDYAERHRLPLVECVSDLDDVQQAALDRLARRVPVVRAVNLTVGNYLQTRLISRLAALDAGLAKAGLSGQAGLLDRHPTSKAHRPSATVTALAGTWEQHSGQPAADVASLRAGPAVSDHDLLWSRGGESLLLRHAVTSLDACAAGVLAAVRWAGRAAPGRYSMHQVFDSILEGP
ncbi:dihydrodipicolinate reductase C-terminal domain-containing protein [Streptacidiphilus sp. P02-A3a]|uniref:dihydrodipicolinate reductase C-terminal domain-containing protein n=1 Tax=Streptacidiphilus sp. P02-A3a TaxID=2704468 RepID=UPI0015FB3988|nr:dihydrodipicolinate reductase C-terminal domain-containing protein [Streptacidiphilus sp. P02-A3a]QMU71500.1 hypothetical protein GXP74_27965 [Streptacidiphilus sp. P02-A3a]